MARLEVAYENQSSRFYRQDQNFQRQFFHIYESRLKQLGDLLRQKVATKYGEKQLITQPVLNLNLHVHFRREIPNQEDIRLK